VKASTVDAINQSVTGQYVVTTESFGPTALPQSMAAELDAVTGVRVAAGVSATFANINDSGKIILAVDPDAISQVIDFDDVDGSFASLGVGEIAASEKLAEEKQLKIGDPVELIFLQGGATTLTLGSIYKTEFPIQGPGWIISTDQFNTLVPPSQQTFLSIYIKLDDTSAVGVDAALSGSSKRLRPIRSTNSCKSFMSCSHSRSSSPSLAWSTRCCCRSMSELANSAYCVQSV
jgi:hypothetical protein